MSHFKLDAAMFVSSRVIATHRQDERADAIVDGTAIEKSMRNVVMWTPALMLACLLAAALVSSRVFEMLDWMVMALGVYIGRDAEAMLRLRKSD